MNTTPTLIDAAGTRVLDHGGPPGAPVLLCLHGFGGSALNWNLVAPRLVPYFRVLAVDLHGHGPSTPLAHPTMENVVEQVQSVVDTVRNEPAGEPPSIILVGNSFGGSVALLAAHRRPATITAVVVVNGALPKRPGWRRDPGMTVKRWLISVPGVSAAMYRKTLAMTAGEYVDMQLTGAGVDPAVMGAELRRQSVTLQEHRHHDRVAHDAQLGLLRSMLKTFERGRAFDRATDPAGVPVLWLHSDSDPLVPHEAAKAFVQQRPAWEFRSRPGLGHVPQIVDPEWVARCITSWVDSPDRRITTQRDLS